MEKSKNVKYITKVGVLTAIATVLMLIEVPLPFAPPFYKLDFSEIPIVIGGFALGPFSCVIMELLKNILHIVIKGTQTAFVGEFANFVTGLALVLPATFIYKYKKTLKGALVGMLCGTVCLAVIGSLINYFVLIPTFSKMYHMPLDTIIKMGTDVNKNISDLKTLIVFAVLPFNLVKSVATFTVSLLLYKRVSRILHI